MANIIIDKQAYDVDDETIKEIIQLIRFRQNGKQLEMSDDIDYQVILGREDEMRKNMYYSNYKNHKMNTDPHYNLVNIDESTLETMIITNYQYSRAIKEASNILFKRQQPLKSTPWDTLQKSIKEELDPLFIEKYKDHIFIAGGKIFSLLFGTKSSDIDIFLHSCDEKTAEEIILAIADKLTKDAKFKIIRTEHALSINVRDRYRYNKYQIIFRLYHSPSEILHGFDVDCCCLGYDGSHIWATERACYALNHGYNLVNFDRLSPSYEYRLAKYGTRGVSVKIPNFDLKLVNRQEINKMLPIFGRIQYLDLNGLDILLVLEARYLTRYGSKKHRNGIEFIEHISREKSDYFDATCKYQTNLANVFEYLIEYAMENPKSVRYNKYLKRMDEIKDDYKQFFVNHLGKTKNFYFISAIKYADSERPIDINFFLHLPDELYDILGSIKKWKFPKDVQFKTIKPGEQMTNTFHQTVLADHSEWYKGKFYNTVNEEENKETEI